MKSVIDKILSLSQEQDFIAKVGSLVLSIILWAYISSIKTGEVRFKINVAHRNLSKKLIVLKSSNNSVLVKLHGKKEHLKNVNIKNLKLFINLKDAKANSKKKYKVHISKNQIPESIKISLVKKRIEVIVERKLRKRIKIHPQYTGNLKSGAAIGKIKIKPEMIYITGAKSIVDKIDTVYTEIISIDKASDDIIKEVELKTSNFKNISFSETNVKVWIPIIKYNNLVKFKSNIIIRNRSDKYSYSIDVRNTRVFLKGNGTDSVTDGDIASYVNAGSKNIIKLIKKNGDKEFKVSVPIKVIIKSSNKKLDIISLDPSKVSLTIKRK